jgi:hypothetical protein
MSGSGGGGGGGGGGEGVTDCAKFHKTTNVISPDPAVLKTVKKDAVGKLRVGKGAREPVEVVFNKQVLGTIGGDRITSLKQCLEEGYEYSATITEIRGGAVTVDIRAS